MVDISFSFSDVQGPAIPTTDNGSFSSHATDTSGFKVDSPNVTNVVPGVVYFRFRSMLPHCRSANK
jgi:hypothetical protein